MGRAEGVTAATDRVGGAAVAALGPALRRGLAASLTLLGCWALQGCGDRTLPSPNRLDAPVAPPVRPSDGLLSDSVLQRIVELQNTGSASGMLEHLYGGSPTARARAALAMGSIREGRASQAVRDQLRHPDPRVRADAAFAIGQMPRADATPVLGLALEAEADSLVRTRLVEALGKAGGATAAEQLALRPLDVAEADLVLALGRIALRIDTASAVTLDRLTESLVSADGHAREMAAWYFGRETRTERWLDRLDAVRAALDGYAAADPASAGLARALGRLSDPTDVPRIKRLLQSDDWRLRVRASAALGSLVADDEARAALFGALDDGSTHVAVAAARSIGAIRRLLDSDKDRIEAWIDQHPEDWRTAVPLLEALASQGRAGFVRQWLETRVEADVHVRSQGIRALARAPDQGVARSLMDLARSDSLVLSAAALAGLAQRWPTERGNRELHQAYWEAFAGALARGDRALVATVAPVMSDSVFLAQGALELLEQTYVALTPLEDVEAAQAIADALGATEDAAAVPTLQLLMSDPHPTVRQRAGEHAQRLSGRRAMVSEEASPVGRSPDWQILSGLGPHPRLVLETDKGRVVIHMAAELAPVTVQTIAELAGAGRYDGVRFHRVVPDFVLQGGDFERGDGYGGPGFVMRSEITGIPYRRGVVGMASAGPDTEGSQFFITHSAQPHLDGDYTAFGWVVEGMDVVDRIYEADRIVAARVEADPGPARADTAPTPEGR